MRCAGSPVSAAREGVRIAGQDVRVTTLPRFVKQLRCPGCRSSGRLRAMPDFLVSLVSSVQAVNPWLLFLLFVIPFVATLVLVPWLVLRLPAVYFMQEQRQPLLWGARHPLLRLLVRILKNL